MAFIKKLVRQLQGGLSALAGLISDQHVEAFYPILLYHEKQDPTPSLRGLNVTFRNGPLPTDSLELR